MRIRTIYRDIPLLASNPNLLSTLEDAGIRTTYDILFTPLPDLLTRLSTANDVLTANIITLQDEIAIASAARGMSGDDLLKTEIATLEFMKPREEGLFGVHALDDLLGPALSGPYVIELSGTSGSGKSTLAVQLVTRLLMQDAEASALWIDGSGDFSAERSLRLCKVSGVKHEVALSILERLQIVLSLETEEFQTTLDNVEASLLGTPEASLRYIIIDPITSILFAQITGTSSQGHASMTSVMQQLARIAQEHKLTVIVINRAATSPHQNILSAFPGVTAKPALGPTFTFLAHATIWLNTVDAALGKSKSTAPGSVRRSHIAEVFRSRVSPSHRWCIFDIEDGIAIPSNHSDVQLLHTPTHVISST